MNTHFESDFTFTSLQSVDECQTYPSLNSASALCRFSVLKLINFRLLILVERNHSEVPSNEVWWSGQYNDFIDPRIPIPCVKMLLTVETLLLVLGSTPSFLPALLRRKSMTVPPPNSHLIKRLQTCPQMMLAGWGGVLRKATIKETPCLLEVLRFYELPKWYIWHAARSS